jgi:hypothetical protein
MSCRRQRISAPQSRSRVLHCCETLLRDSEEALIPLDRIVDELEHHDSNIVNHQGQKTETFCEPKTGLPVAEIEIPDTDGTDL